MKRVVFLVLFLLISVPATSFAHSGGTDSNGGHHDYNNVSGLGDYHYHHGMGPHLHDGGVCPYNTPVESVTEAYDYSDDVGDNPYGEIPEYTYDYDVMDGSYGETLSLSEYDIVDVVNEVADTSNDMVGIIFDAYKTFKQKASDSRASDFTFIIIGLVMVAYCLAVGFFAARNAKR